MRVACVCGVCMQPCRASGWPEPCHRHRPRCYGTSTHEAATQPHCTLRLACNVPALAPSTDTPHGTACTAGRPAQRPCRRTAPHVLGLQQPALGCVQRGPGGTYDSSRTVPHYTHRSYLRTHMRAQHRTLLCRRALASSEIRMRCVHSAQRLVQCTATSTVYSD